MEGAPSSNRNLPGGGGGGDLPDVARRPRRDTSPLDEKSVGRA
jgi:hypothetical protein